MKKVFIAFLLAAGALSAAGCSNTSSTDKKVYDYIVAETPKMHDKHPDSPTNMMNGFAILDASSKFNLTVLDTAKDYEENLNKSDGKSSASVAELEHDSLRSLILDGFTEMNDKWYFDGKEVSNMGQTKTSEKELQPLFTDKEIYDYVTELTPELTAKYGSNHGGLVDGLAAIDSAEHFSMTVMDELRAYTRGAYQAIGAQVPAQSKIDDLVLMNLPNMGFNQSNEKWYYMDQEVSNMGDLVSQASK